MTNNDPAIRKQALENAKAAVDATLVLGAKVMVFWNGREGFDFVLAKNGRDAFKRLVEGFNAVGQYALEKYGPGKIRFGHRAQAQRAARQYVPGDCGRSVSTSPAGWMRPCSPLFGVNPETAHSRIAGLDYVWDVEMCLEAGKLFHIHLNAQDGQRYDQDLPFGYTEPLKDLALCVVLQDAKYEGIIAFDVKAHAHRR